MRIALYNGLSPKKCCIQRKLTKIQFDTIINEIITTYNKSIVQPGEMTGVLSAQSLGEPLTQMTLNSFHASGIKTISSTTTGIPRLRELLSYSKNIKTPQMIVSLVPEFNKNKDMAHKIASSLKNTLLGDIRGRINIYYDNEPDEENSIMKNDNVKNVYYSSKSTKNSCSSNYKELPWLMRIEILKDKMLEKEISLLDIKSKFCNWWEKRYLDNKLLRKEEKRVLNKITNLAVLSNTDNDEQPVIHIRFNVKDVDKVKDPFNREMLNEFIDEIIDMFKLKGLDAISSIPDIPVERNMVIDTKTNEIKFENQYMIYTIGTNLIDIRYIIGIDVLNTISNDIYDVYKTFGIEIARSRLLRELERAYGDSATNYTNLSILVDIMTNGGNIMSIDRHGLNKSEIDVLGRASFESTVEQILTAGLFGEIDNMKGVSSRMIGGLVIKGGTGFCDVVLDTNLIEKSEYSGENKYSVYNEINTDKLAKDIITNDTGDMFIPM
jgi:DNA-directed RNA polymerase II subunit RPB1